MKTYATAEHRQFCLFLEAYPEAHQTLKDIADSFNERIKDMGLPQNRDCLSFMTRVLDFMNGDPRSPQAQKIYNSVTGLDKYGPQLTPEDMEFQKQLARGLAAELSEDQEFLDIFRQRKAISLIDEMKKSSRGMNDHTRRDLIKFMDENHAQAIAELVAEATAWTLLEPEAGSHKMADFDEPDERDRFYRVTTDMVGCMTYEVLDEMDKLFVQDAKDRKMMQALFAKPASGPPRQEP